MIDPITAKFLTEAVHKERLQQAEMERLARQVSTSNSGLLPRISAFVSDVVRPARIAAPAPKSFYSSPAKTRS